VAPGLPRRLAPVLPTTYSARFVPSRKASVKPKHSESPRHACAHCGVFATAAPRGAGTSISVSLSGQPLSWPLPVIGLVSHYLTNYLMGRRPILKCRSFAEWEDSTPHSVSGIILSFPRLFQTLGYVIDVLLSSLPCFRIDLHVLAGF
jgi:hypothetical protein